jgi:hypothetical protein
MGYRIASAALVLLFGMTWAAAYLGWWLPTTAAVEAKRQAIYKRRSARTGYYGGGGPRFGK